MAIPFAWQKRPTARRPVMDESVDDFIARQNQVVWRNPVPDPALGQDASPSYPANIDPNYIPPAIVEAAPSVVAGNPPAVDPALLAAVRPRRTQQIATTIAEPPQEPVVSRSGQIMDENATRSRRVETDKSGRPIANPTIASRSERLSDLGERVDEYEPRPEPKWKRYLRLGVGAASLVGGAVARDPRTVAMAASGLARNISNSKAPDEDWKREQQAVIGQQLEQVTEREKGKAQLAHLKAQTKKLGETPAVKPRALKIETDANGFLRAIDTDNGKADFVRDDQGEPVRAKANVRYDTEYDEATGRTYRTENGKRMGLMKAPDLIVPGYGAISPNTKYNADVIGGRQAESEAERVRQANEVAAQENARIKENIGKLEREKQTLQGSLYGPNALSRTVEKMVPNETGNGYVKQTVPNPLYQKAEERWQHIDDDILKENGRIKPILSAPAPRTPAPGPVNNTPPPGGYTIEGAIAAWKAKPENHGKQPSKNQIADWQKKIDAANQK